MNTLVFKMLYWPVNVLLFIIILLPFSESFAEDAILPGDSNTAIRYMPTTKKAAKNTTKKQKVTDHSTITPKVSKKKRYQNQLKKTQVKQPSLVKKSKKAKAQIKGNVVDNKAKNNLKKQKKLTKLKKNKLISVKEKSNTKSLSLPKSNRHKKNKSATLPSSKKASDMINQKKTKRPTVTHKKKRV